MATLLDPQIMSAEESTYGTRVVPTRTLEFVDEALKRRTEHIESAGLRKGNRVLRSDRRVVNHKDAGGTITYEVATNGFGLEFKHMLGASVVTQPDVGANPTVYLNTVTLADPDALSRTIQVGRPDVNGTVRPFDYLGAKVAEWQLTQELDQLLRLALTIDAREEKDDQTLAVAAYPASQAQFHWRQCVVEVDSSEVFTTMFSAQGNNTLKTDRFGLGTNALKRKPLANGRTVVTGSLAGEFESLAQYDRFVDGTVVPIVATWTGAVISGGDGSYNFKIVLTLAAVQFDGETPSVGGPGVIEQPAPFTVLDNGTDPAVKLEYYTTDSAA